jgi:hypothetical protein
VSEPAQRRGGSRSPLRPDRQVTFRLGWVHVEAAALGLAMLASAIVAVMGWLDV